MKSTFIQGLLSVICLLSLLSGCGNLPDTNTNITPTTTPNIQETVDAVVAMTATAQVDMEQKIEEAVQSTVQALPSPTPAPTVEAAELTEEELAELIDEAVEEAVSASEQVYSTTSQATYDDAISEEDLYYLDYYLYAAELALMYADDMIALYFEYYEDYAYEAIEVLLAIEDDLEIISESLEEIDMILQQGAEAASAAIEQLSEAATSLETHHDQLQTSAQDWLVSVQTGKEDRLNELENLMPSETAGNLEGALVLLHEYVDSVKTGFTDGKISIEEWADIAQRGVNAQVSIEQFARPAMQNLSESIGSITNMIAFGQWPQAKMELPEFELSLPEKPSGPSISLPGRP